MAKTLETVNYPSWHFIGSKKSMINWIFDQIKDLQYSTVLDLFGGSGIISHEFQLQNKTVYYNDFLKHLQISCNGLLNSSKKDIITKEQLNQILTVNQNTINEGLFTQLVSNKYFFPSEAIWIETVYNNIFDPSSKAYSPNQQHLLFFALTQSCLKKRPFHTFHGSFLNLRLKKREELQTWDLAMDETFKKKIFEINTYLTNLPEFLPSVSISGFNASECKPEYFSNNTIDLVYIDPPFISNKKKRTLKFANYVKNYSVLELLTNLKEGSKEGLTTLQKDELLPGKYLPYQEMNLWLDQNQKNWLIAFENIIKSFQDSTIVVSYRSDSLITVEEIASILSSYKDVSFSKTSHIYEKPIKESKFDDVIFIGR